MIHFTFIISLNQRLSSADIKIICWLDKDKGKNGVFYIPRMSNEPKEQTSVFSAVVHFESNLNEQK